MGSRDEDEEEFIHDIIRQSTAGVPDNVADEYDAAQFLDLTGHGGDGDNENDGDEDGDDDEEEIGQGTEAEVIKDFDISMICRYQCRE